MGKSKSDAEPIVLEAGEEKITFTELLRSMDHDVVKVHAHTHRLGVAAEYEWIRRRYPESERLQQSLTTLDLITGKKKFKKDQIHFDVITIRLPDGREKEIYFDISSFFTGDVSSLLDPDAFIAIKIAELYKSGGAPTDPGSHVMTRETDITESASKILEVLVQRGAVAGHELKVHDLVAASGLSDSEFDRADTYLLQVGHVGGTMGGRHGSRWLTPSGIQFHQSRSRPAQGQAVARRHERYERIAVFAFGVAFVVALLVLAIAFPEPTAFQYTVFRIVLALAASGIVAFVPGFIEVDVNRWLRAGGAIAVFVIIYFFSPANLVTEQARVPSSQQSDRPR